MFIPDTTVTIEMQPIEVGADSVRAIDDGRVVNTTVFTSGVTVLTLYQNDEFTTCDQGYENGDQIVLQLFDATYKMWFATQFTLADSVRGVAFNSEPIFVVDGLYFIEWMDGHTPLSIEISEEPIADEAPYMYRVDPAYPNPFNPTTTITVAVAHSQPIRVMIHDMLGRLVMERRIMAQGATVYALDVDLSQHGSGVYAVTILGENFVNTQAITMVK